MAWRSTTSFSIACSLVVRSSEFLEVSFTFGGLFPQFAKLGDGFVVTFLCIFGDSDLGLELLFVYPHGRLRLCSGLHGPRTGCPVFLCRFIGRRADRILHRISLRGVSTVVNPGWAVSSVYVPISTTRDIGVCGGGGWGAWLRGGRPKG